MCNKEPIIIITMTKTEIIRKCELYLDDSSEMSTQEMGELFDKVYDAVCSYKPWEFTKRSHTATVAGTVTTLPTNFLSLTRNYDSDYGEDPVVFVGATFIPFTVVNWSDRRRYTGHPNKAYLDIPNNQMVFTSTLNDTVEFDYHAKMPVLAVGESPVFPEQFHHIIYHGMAVEELMIEQYEKARSYAPENRQKYQDYLDRMSYWNSRLVQL